MEKNFLMVCDNVFVDAQQKLNITGVFDVIATTGVPALTKSMFIIAGFTLPAGQYTEFARIKRGSWEIKTPESSITKANEIKHRFIHNFSNVVFPEIGEYFVEIEINGNVVAKDKIYLKLQ